MTEAANDHKATWEILDSGRCLWHGVTDTGAHLVRIPYDYWYELGKVDDDLEPEEEPELGPDGFGYYIIWGDDPRGCNVYGVSSPTMKTPDEARIWADRKAKATVKWTGIPNTRMEGNG